MVEIVDVSAPETLPVEWVADAGRIIFEMVTTVAVTFEATGSPPAGDYLVQIALQQDDMEHVVYSTQTIDMGLYHWLTEIDGTEAAPVGSQRTFGIQTDDDSDRIISQYQTGTYDGLQPGEVEWVVRIIDPIGAEVVAGPVTAPSVFELGDAPVKENTEITAITFTLDGQTIMPQAEVTTRANHSFTYPLDIEAASPGQLFYTQSAAPEIRGAIAGQQNTTVVELPQFTPPAVVIDGPTDIEYCVEPAADWA